MIPRVEPEGMLFRKPVPIPDQVEDMLFGIMRYRRANCAAFCGWASGARR